MSVLARFLLLLLRVLLRVLLRRPCSCCVRVAWNAPREESPTERLQLSRQKVSRRSPPESITWKQECVLVCRFLPLAMVRSRFSCSSSCRVFTCSPMVGSTVVCRVLKGRLLNTAIGFGLLPVGIDGPHNNPILNVTECPYPVPAHLNLGGTAPPNIRRSWD
jgi:hypothetical protein